MSKIDLLSHLSHFIFCYLNLLYLLSPGENQVSSTALEVKKIIYYEDLRTDFIRFSGINLADSNTKGDTMLMTIRAFLIDSLQKSKLRWGRNTRELKSIEFHCHLMTKMHSYVLAQFQDTSSLYCIICLLGRKGAQAPSSNKKDSAMPRKAIKQHGGAMHCTAV